MKNRFSIVYGIAMCAIVSLAISCIKDNNTVDPNANIPDINLVDHPVYGRYLTNKQGQTLYMFANDVDGLSVCSGTCEKVWPLFNTDLTTAKLATGLEAADFTIITTATGRQQVAYKGWPLYTYAPAGPLDNNGNATYVPEASGETKGEGIGGVWFIAKTNYTIMLANKQLTGADGNNYLGNYTVGNGKTVYFTNDKGRTIYTFVVDSFNINKFTKPDFSNNPVWPIYEEDRIEVPSILDKSLFGSILVFGRKQMTYKGWPLYYFGQDTQRGLNKGVSVPVPGKWPVAVKNMLEAKR